MEFDSGKQNIYKSGVYVSSCDVEDKFPFLFNPLILAKLPFSLPYKHVNKALNDFLYRRHSRAVWGQPL